MPPEWLSAGVRVLCFVETRRAGEPVLCTIPLTETDLLMLEAELVSIFTSAFVVYDVCWLVTVACSLSWLAFGRSTAVAA